jgi:xylitol oxidase
MTPASRNWAGNLTYSAARLHHPATVADVQAIVAESTRVKALGSRHSFNTIADTTGDLIALDRLPREMTIGRDRRSVTVDGGATYGDVGRALFAEGLALHNLASLPHISVAGACATGTHGSGDANGSLATAVTALEIVTASGEILPLSREADGARFAGAVVNLGALGIITRLTLQVEPAYEVRQEVFEALPFDALDDVFEAIASSAHSVSLFTSWQGAHVDQVWVKSRVSADAVHVPNDRLHGATAATGDRHPIAGISAEHCTPQQGVAGPWHERLPHFRLEFTPSSGEELQSDYLVPRRHARQALHAVHALGDDIAPLLQVSEIRTVAGDDLWMSPCYEQPCVSLHFTWQPDGPAVRALLPRIEAVLAPLDARPHWGKLFTMTPARVRALYPRLPEFRALASELDPLGKFRNAFLDAYLFGEDER